MSETPSTTTTTSSSDAPSTPAPAKKVAAKKTATKRAARTQVSGSGSKTAQDSTDFKPVKLVRKGVVKTAFSPSEKVALEFDGYRAK